jgi:hypothetical protein
MFRRGRLLWLLILAVAFVLPAGSMAQHAQGKIDYERMRQDLDIMETILRKLLAATLVDRSTESEVFYDLRGNRISAAVFGRRESVGSVYLEDFGVIFDVDYHGGSTIESLVRKRLERELLVMSRRLKNRQWSLTRGESGETRKVGIVAGKVIDKTTGLPVEGAYVFVDEYGAVTDATGEFTIEGVVPGKYTVVVRAPGYKETTSEKLLVGKGRKTSITLAMEADKTIDRLKTQLVTFLSTYADAIGQLSSSQWIMVVVNFSGKQFGQHSEEVGLERLEARVRRRYIADFRRGKIDLDAFRKRVKFREITSTEADTDLDIFVEIMKTVFEKRRGEASLTADEIQGFYLDDVGALVKIEARRAFMVLTSDVVFKRTSEGKIIKVTPQPKPDRTVRASTTEKKEDVVREMLEEFKAQVVGVVADFGHTLRRIPSTGWIAVVSEIASTSFGDPLRLVCRVSKQDIDDFNRRRIDRQEFAKRVTWREF